MRSSCLFDWLIPRLLVASVRVPNWYKKVVGFSVWNLSPCWHKEFMRTIIRFQQISQLLTFIKNDRFFNFLLLLCFYLVNVVKLIIGVYFIKDVIVRVSFINVRTSIQLFSSYLTFLSCTVSWWQGCFWSQFNFECHFFLLESLCALPDKILIRGLVSGWSIPLNFHLVLQSLSLIFLNHDLNRVLIFHSF